MTIRKIDTMLSNTMLPCPHILSEEFECTLQFCTEGRLHTIVGVANSPSFDEACNVLISALLGFTDELRLVEVDGFLPSLAEFVLVSHQQSQPSMMSRLI